MDKTLETVALIHRLIIGVALALLIAGVSAYSPNNLYDLAEGDLHRLEEAITTISDQVNKDYETIYDQSDLKVSTLAWLQKRSSVQHEVDINVVSVGDLAIPDSDRDPSVTLDVQLKWADLVYRNLENTPILLCVVDRDQVFHALDKLFDTSRKPDLQALSVYLHGPQTSAYANHQFKCDIELQYRVQMGKDFGLRSAILDLPTTVVNVDRNIPWTTADVFKEEGLGDWEDNHALPVPALRALWAEIGSRSPQAATAFLEQKKKEEIEKSKEKIEILGESLSRSLTIMMASLVELCLMVYLLAHLVQIRITLPGHETAVSEAPFFGIVKSGLGRLVMLFTFLIPFGICLFVLVDIFPSFQTEWSGPQWIVGPASRWGLIAGIGITDALLVLEVTRIIAALGHRRRHTVSAGGGPVARTRRQEDDENH